ncbi:MAG: hypothetical protein V3V93_03555 [bacterium]
MPQGTSQDSGTSSLEESILERYSKKSVDPPKNEVAEEGPENPPSALEEDILNRYSGENAETPPPSKAEESSEETPSGSLEDDILKRYAQPTQEAKEGTEPSQAEVEGVSSGSQEEDILKRYAGAGSEEEPEADEPAQGAPVVPPDKPEPEEPLDERPAPVVQAPVTRAVLPTSPDEVVETLRQLREDVGQISELSSEEGSIVTAFAIAFLKLMEPLTKALPVDAAVLPLELGDVEKANVLPKGDLVVLYRDGRMESIDLKDAENRDLLVTVVSDVTPRFNALISKRRSKIEKRITFLSSVTKELQSIADSMVEGD